LRRLELDGVEVIDSFDADQVPPGGAGQVLAPWPNRLEDGRSQFDGVLGSAAVNEPDRQNAIHGLVRWLSWQAVEQGESEVTLETVIVPQPAYPWRLRLRVSYTITASALSVRFAAHNESALRAPFGIGFHPYFLAEGADVDRASLAGSVAEHLLLDDRALPVGSEAASTSRFGAIASDDGLALSGVALDDCFALDTTARRAPAVRYSPGPHSRTVTITMGPSFTHLMCFTGDTLASLRRRRSLAIEPMTCPPNALRTGVGLSVIERGGVCSGEFIVAVDPPG
jgi:aldose 1-epimerase